MTMNDEPRLIKGGIAVDDRGSVSFTNDFHFEGVKRYYMIRNHRQGFIRAWHGHRFEGKYFTVVKGSALVCGVKIDDWANPSRSLPVHRYVLTDIAPSVLYLPGGYANGEMSLTEDAQIMVFSTSTLQESVNDDVRWDQNHWNPWTIESR
ncbi:MAG: sugar epimerase [Bacteroidetes bacterium]|nr:MAG: sugar epimerase [Bacteroidota bacterium]